MSARQATLFFCCSPLDVGESSFAPIDCTKLLLCGFSKNERQNTENLFWQIFTVISKRSHKYSPWESDPAAQHLSRAVQFSTSQNKTTPDTQPPLLPVSDTCCRPITSTLPSKGLIKHLGCPFMLMVPHSFSSHVWGRGDGEQHSI